MIMKYLKRQRNNIMSKSIKVIDMRLVSYTRHDTHAEHPWKSRYFFFHDDTGLSDVTQ